MNQKQRNVLEKHKKEIFKAKKIIEIFEIIFVIGLFSGWIIHWLISIICLILVIAFGFKEINYKKELREIEYKLAEN